MKHAIEVVERMSDQHKIDGFTASLEGEQVIAYVNLSEYEQRSFAA